MTVARLVAAAVVMLGWWFLVVALGRVADRQFRGKAR
jgi:hypothetical protein